MKEWGGWWIFYLPLKIYIFASILRRNLKTPKLKGPWSKVASHIIILSKQVNTIIKNLLYLMSLRFRIYKIKDCVYYSENQEVHVFLQKQLPWKTGLPIKMIL